VTDPLPFLSPGDDAPEGEPGTKRPGAAKEAH